jgi:hypothetical protein
MIYTETKILLSVATIVTSFLIMTVLLNNNNKKEN